MTARVDIHDPLFEICERLGLEPAFVKEMFITPTTITATVYAKNENGKKHIDAATQLAAAATEEFKVQT